MPKPKPMKSKPKLSDEEVKKLARELVTNLVFMSDQICRVEDITQVFPGLMFCSVREMKSLTKDFGAFYEYKHEALLWESTAIRCSYRFGRSTRPIMIESETKNEGCGSRWAKNCQEKEESKKEEAMAHYYNKTSRGTFDTSSAEARWEGIVHEDWTTNGGVPCGPRLRYTLYKKRFDGYYLVYWSAWPGTSGYAEEVSAREAARWLCRNKHQLPS